jgi:hypothetical protein
MKKISIVLAILALALLLSTCAQKTSPTTIDECISSFMKDINSTDRSGVYKNLNPSSAKYAQASYAVYWGVFFPIAEIPYTVSSQSTSGSTVTASVTSATGVTYPTGTTLTFVMGEDSDKNAVISTITYKSGIVSMTIFN